MIKGIFQVKLNRQHLSHNVDHSFSLKRLQWDTRGQFLVDLKAETWCILVYKYTYNTVIHVLKLNHISNHFDVYIMMLFKL